MNKEINHWCKVCGVGYFACNACDRKDMIMWRAVACKPEHFQAYTVLCQYSDGSITKEQAKDYLESLIDVEEELVDYPEPTKGQLMEILSVDKPKEVEVKVEEVAEQPKAVVDGKTENKHNENKPNKFGKRA